MGPQDVVTSASQLLIADGDRVMVPGSQQVGNFLRKVLVYLKSHKQSSRSRSQRNEIKTIHCFRRKVQRRLDVFPFQLGVACENLLERISVGDAPNNDAHWNARTRDAGIAVVDIGLDADSFVPIG
jgi:hypothetical protein